MFEIQVGKDLFSHFFLLRGAILPWSRILSLILRFTASLLRISQMCILCIFIPCKSGRNAPKYSILQYPYKPNLAKCVIYISQ